MSDTPQSNNNNNNNNNDHDNLPLSDDSNTNNKLNIDKNDGDDEQFSTLADLPENVLADAMRQLTDPNKPLLAEELTTTATNTTTTATTSPTPKQPWENQEPIAINDQHKNSRRVICPFCLKSLILLPNAATLVSKEIFLPYPNASTQDEGCSYNDHFKVTSKMDFENIEVKRAVVGQTFRYLTCADCGSGPLGITYDADNNRIFYISHDRIRYGK